MPSADRAYLQRPWFLSPSQKKGYRNFANTLVFSWYCGWTKSCTTCKPGRAIVSWYLQGNHHSRVSLAAKWISQPSRYQLAVLLISHRLLRGQRTRCALDEAMRLRTENPVASRENPRSSPWKPRFQPFQPQSKPG